VHVCVLLPTPSGRQPYIPATQDEHEQRFPAELCCPRAFRTRSGPEGHFCGQGNAFSAPTAPLEMLPRPAAAAMSSSQYLHVVLNLDCLVAGTSFGGARGFVNVEASHETECNSYLQGIPLCLSQPPSFCIVVLHIHYPCCVMAEERSLPAWGWSLLLLVLKYILVCMRQPSGPRVGRVGPVSLLTRPTNGTPS
jgi:hypothetical protein